MLTFEFSMNIISLFALSAVAAYVGFRFRTGQIRKNRLQVLSLEREMVSSHAEILELQKEYLELEAKFQSLLSSMSVAKPTAKPASNEKITDMSMRKKLRPKSNIDPSIGEGYHLNYSGLVNKDVQIAPFQY